MNDGSPFISVLIPVLNESDILKSSIIKVHDYLVDRQISHEIIVVSNGSTDSTQQIGLACTKEFDWVRFFHLPEKGVGSAFVLAVKEAKGDLLVSLDVDLSFDLRFIRYAIDLLQYADMVVGSKTMGRQRRSLLRVIPSQCYILLAQVLFGLTVSDYSIGCKAYRKDAILNALPFIESWTGYVFELCLYLHFRDRRIIQVGVDCDDRRKSHFSLLHEGFHRYAHMYKCWRLMRSADSWLTAP